MSGCRWVITPLWLSGSWRYFLYSSSVYYCHLFLISSASIRSILFLSFIVRIFVWNVPLVSLILTISTLLSSRPQPSCCVWGCYSRQREESAKFLREESSRRKRETECLYPTVRWGARGKLSRGLIIQGFVSSILTGTLGFTLSEKEARLPWWLGSKESTSNTEDTSAIPGSGRSPGEGNGYLLQYSCLGNPMDSLVGYHPCDRKRVRHDLTSKQQWETGLVYMWERLFRMIQIIWNDVWFTNRESENEKSI